ncbi:glycosyltransferase family 4 protein [Patescibacteria group bacterium]|nr:glycosyltransferase family 4 protein [Patescibacteria group bacterium]
MKIAQVTSLIESVPPLHNNGLEFIVHFLTDGLVDKGHEVTLFATGDSQTDAELTAVWPKAASRDVLAKDISRGIFSKWSHEAAFLRADEFDIIHTHDFYGMSWCLMPAPLVMTVHCPAGDYEEYKKKFPVNYWPYFKQLENKLKNGYTVFVSESQRSHFPSGRHHYVVHNGVPVEDFSFSDKPEDYFVFLGYISENKGPHLAIQAADAAGVKLKIAGNRFLNKAFFNEQMKPFLRAGRIEYLGSLGYEEKIRLLRGAKAVFVPIQWKEPFGLVMIEAMSCGTPVIALNRASVPEIVVDGKTGFICNSVDEMAEAAKNIDKISRLECRRHVEKNFSVGKMVEGYEKVYERIISDFQRRFKK